MFLIMTYLKSKPREEDDLTHGDQVPAGLQHHISVEPPLSIIQESPLFPREVHSHIGKDQNVLKYPTYSDSKRHFFINIWKRKGEGDRDQDSIPRTPELMEKDNKQANLMLYTQRCKAWKSE